MTAADYEHGDSAPAGLFRWILPALVLSLLLHMGLWYWARGVSLTAQSEKYYEKVVPRAFHIDQVKIDPKLLEPEPDKDKRQALAPQAVAIPEDKIAFEKLMADTKGEPSAPKIDQTILSDKPSPASTTLDAAMQTAQRTGAQSVLEDSSSLQQALLDEKPDAGGRSLDQLVAPDALAGRAIAKAGKLRGGDTPGFSNLDELLAQTGPLSPETAPILMPTDLLFDYDKADLQPEALASLEKLGTLIRRNPQATFLIEGHTDSFGSDEYNLELSQRRAETVKAWLLGAMQIPAGRVEAKGFGKTRLIAPASGTIEEQQINRRVEIVIRSK